MGIPLERRDLLRGGIDFQNADGAVMFQEFTLAKVATTGALVGQRTDPASRFEAGISGSDVIDPTEAATIGVGSWQVARDRRSMNLFAVPYASLTNRAQQLQTATDFIVEPPRWVIDPNQLAAGIVAFQDPRGPNGVWNEGTGDDVVNPLGENCTGIYAAFPDAGCTPLEVLSANLERSLITTEILGRGQAFDPPETLAEIQAMLDGDPSNDATGDPVAGPDGIRWNNFDVDDGVVSDGISETGDQKAGVGKAGLVVVASFMDCLRGTRSGGPIGPAGRECYLNLDNPATRPLPPPVNGIFASRDSLGRLLAMLPIGLRLNYRNTDGSTVNPSPNPSLSSAAFPFQRLTPSEMQILVQSGELVVSRDAIFTPEEVAELTSMFNAPIPTTILITEPGSFPGALRFSFFGTTSGYDVDNNATLDVDEDQDNTFDFID
ncbi:MAG: hypothetical protein L0206_18525, partial [Actinobacteria bacterium]|nr:hypothetical protein [Actinomycetota bacterium]